MFSYTAQLSIFNLFVIRTRRMETFGKMRCRFQELEQNSPKKQKSNHRTQNGAPNSGLECAGGAKSHTFWRKVAPKLNFRHRGHTVQTRSALALADRKTVRRWFHPPHSNDFLPLFPPLSLAPCSSVPSPVPLSALKNKVIIGMLDNSLIPKTQELN